MNSFPEIIVGKPFKNWKRRHLIFISLVVGLLGAFLWLLAPLSISFLRPRFNLPWLVVGLGVTPIFFGVLFAMTTIRLWSRVPKSAVGPKPTPLKPTSPRKKKPSPSRFQSLQQKATTWLYRKQH